MFSAPAFASLPPTTVGQLFDVVHHAVQVPLCVDLIAPTQIQTRKLFIVPEVAKYRLDGADALTVNLLVASSSLAPPTNEHKGLTLS